jgi:hypothetical protein
VTPVNIYLALCPNKPLIRRKKRVHSVTLILILIVLLGSLATGKTAIAAEETSLPPAATRQEVNVIRQVATLLVAGRDAMLALRGPRIENSNLDQLKLETPGMHCGIERVLSYVACYSDSLMSKKDAESMLTRLMDDVQTALPSDSWRQLEGVPYISVVRSISYQHRKSGARIEIDLMAHAVGEAQNFYSLRVFGWTRP